MQLRHANASAAAVLHVHSERESSPATGAGRRLPAPHPNTISFHRPGWPATQRALHPACQLTPLLKVLVSRVLMTPAFEPTPHSHRCKVGRGRRWHLAGCCAVPPAPHATGLPARTAQPAGSGVLQRLQHAAKVAPRAALSKVDGAGGQHKPGAQQRRAAARAPAGRQAACGRDREGRSQA